MKKMGWTGFAYVETLDDNYPIQIDYWQRDSLISGADPFLILKDELKDEGIYRRDVLRIEVELEHEPKDYNNPVTHVVFKRPK